MLDAGRLVNRARGRAAGFGPVRSGGSRLCGFCAAAVRWIETGAYFVFHFANGFETSGTITVD